MNAFIQNPKIRLNLNEKKTKMEINTENESQRCDQPFVMCSKIDALHRTHMLWREKCSLLVCLHLKEERKREKKEILIIRE